MCDGFQIFKCSLRNHWDVISMKGAETEMREFMLNFNSPKPIYIIINEFFFIENQDKFLTNLSVHSINTRNKQHLRRPMANLSCFQKGTSHCGIRIFNSLPQSITSFRNEKPQFRVALKIILLSGWIFCMYRWHVLLTDMAVYCIVFIKHSSDPHKTWI